MFSAIEVSRKAAHLAQKQALPIFLFYAGLLPAMVILSLFPVLGGIASQFISTAFALCFFIQLRKAYRGEIERATGALQVLNQGDVLSKTVKYMLAALALLFPIGVVLGVLFMIGALQATPGQPMQFNSGTITMLAIGGLFSLIYMYLFLMPCTMFALELAVIKPMRVRDALRFSFDTFYRHIGFITRFCLLQLIPMIILMTLAALMIPVFKENPAQLAIFETGLFILFLVPMFIYFMALRVTLYAELFDRPMLETSSEPSTFENFEI
jgi:hypothetical protein